MATPGAEQHSTLFEPVSLDIDDATARKWIADGYDDLGWRVLIERHDAALIPELVASLPASFAGIDHLPVLAHLRYVNRRLRLSLLNY